jgi:hypothetical protein
MYRKSSPDEHEGSGAGAGACSGEGNDRGLGTGHRDPTHYPKYYPATLIPYYLRNPRSVL